ncbi:hypothetical protein CCR75_007311 [Bremia lactucae]|uniref:Uncharacterized protein n=1 Tax=Bremia lactucae TaxID=4779 RepID=A0A976FJ36_BRELC|nr:hypothetical protein CCR75_007311 [Bremia lactucae]
MLETSAQPPALPSVSSSEMFTALVEEVAETLHSKPVQAWCATVRHLFAEVYNSVPVRSEELPAERKRFPSHKADEAGLLLNLFEQAHVTRRGSFSDWKQMDTAITHEILSMKWAFKDIIRRFSSQHKWSQSPVLSQWAQVVRTGAALASPEPPRNSKRHAQI